MNSESAVPFDNKQPYTKLKFAFRFPVKQIDERNVEVLIPVGGIDVLSSLFIRDFQLSASETEAATLAALKEIAIVK